MAGKSEIFTKEYHCDLISGTVLTTYETRSIISKGRDTYGQMLDSVTLMTRCSGFNKCGISKAHAAEHMADQPHKSQIFRACPANPQK